MSKLDRKGKMTVFVAFNVQNNKQVKIYFIRDMKTCFAFQHHGNLIGKCLYYLPECFIIGKLCRLL